LKEFVLHIKESLDSQLQFIRLETGNNIKTAEMSIEILLSIIERIKKFIIKYKFKTETEEISFFKNLKPQFVSQLIYQNAVLNIETKKPYGGESVLRIYFQNELDKLKRFFDNNLEFYKYYRTSSTYLDYKYFMRGKHDIKLGLDTFYFETDHRFCTSHDYKVAKIIANDLIQVYIEDLLASLDTKEASITSVTPSLKLHWSENKTSLIELIYALYSQNVFDNGKADIKTIAAYFENVFNIELGDYYRTYLELRTRKTSRTKFIDILKVSLEKRMDEVEDK